MILSEKTSKLVLLLYVMIASGCGESSVQNKKIETLNTPEVLEINSVETERAPIYYSNDAGTTWKPMITNLPSEIQASFFSELSGELIFASDNLGLFISESNRTKWKPVGKDLPGKKINALQVYDGKIYVGIYQEGIYMSKDGGEQWISINKNLKDLRIQSILKQKDFFLVGTDSGLLKYDFKQNTWNAVLDGEQVVSLNFDAGKIIAGTTAGVFLSNDNGSSWSSIHQEGALHNTAILDGLIIAMYISGDLYVSGNWGEDWTKSNYRPNASSYVYEVAYIDGLFLLSNNYGVHISNDRGKNWTHIYKEEDFVFLDFLVLNNVIYGGTRDWNERREKTDFFKF